jgi:outer membrane protein TolC
MSSRNAYGYGIVAAWVLGGALTLAGCSVAPPKTGSLEDQIAASQSAVPGSYPGTSDANNSSGVDWQEFFGDPFLADLINGAIENNQELNILKQEIVIARNEVDARSGEYLPFVDIGADIGTEKVGKFTRNGAVEENLPLREGKAFPEPLPDYMFGLSASWELDVWQRLRNAKKSALLRYLTTREGRNFMQTHLVAEIADSYYELLALDNSLLIVERMLAIQEQALAAVRLQKSAGRATELAVRRFEAELLKNQSQVFGIRQNIVEAENRINFLAGRYPQEVDRKAVDLESYALRQIALGEPGELLSRRPDVRQAELELAATRLDVDVARAQFYPRLEVSAAIGLQSNLGGSLLTTPESFISFR